MLEILAACAIVAGVILGLPAIYSIAYDQRLMRRASEDTRSMLGKWLGALGPVRSKKPIGYNVELKRGFNVTTGERDDSSF